MKKITSFLFFCLVACVAWAGPVSRQQAEQIAKSYLQQQRVSRMGGQLAKLTLAYECVPKSGRSLSTSNPLYYVFNQDQQGGFIVIAGDDRMRSVLGYVDNGDFNLQKANDGVRWWLMSLEETMAQLVQCPEKEAQKVQLFEEPAVKPYVLPLVKVHWGQYEPYNNLCPEDSHHGYQSRSLVGCSAVALAQILSKWKYPVKGEGVVDYISSTHHDHIHLDLSTMTFDWDNMLPTYKKGTTAVEQKAVAELMYACGAALRMSYCCLASGTFCRAHLLEQHFGIDSGCNDLERIYFTRQEWDNIIKTELSEGRPVLYNGFNSSFGHAFVCDGYNAEGLFHINWGWDGSMDGYFALAELNSSVEYAGAPTGDDAHMNNDQSITCGIQPKRAENMDLEGMLYYNTFATKSLTAPRTNVKVKIDYVNSDGNGFVGQIGLGIFDSNDEFKGLIGEPMNYNIAPHNFMDELELKGAVPEEIGAGNYMLYPVCKTGDHAFVKMAGRKGSPHVPCLLMNISGHIVRLSVPENLLSELELVDCKVLTQKCFAGFPNDLELTVKNNGGLFYGPLVITYNDADRTVNLYENTYVIESGEEKKIKVRFNAPEGVGKANLDIWQYDGDRDGNLGNGFARSSLGSFSYDLAVPAAGAPELSIPQIKVENPTAYLDEDLLIKLSIANKGGFYGDNIYCFVFPEGGGNSLNSVHRNFLLNKGDTESCDINLPLSGLPAGNYFFQVYYLDEDKQYHTVSSEAYYFRILDNGQLSISNTEGYGVWAVNHAFVVPEACECGVVTVFDRNMLKVDYRYHAGDVVPARTPVVVKTSRRGTYPYQVVVSDEPAPADNLLQTATDERGITCAGEGDFWYYGFDRDHTRKHYGFYLQRKDGSAFKLKINEAYLAVPAGTALEEGYRLAEAVTGVDDVVAGENQTASEAIYTLGGVRVEGPVKNLPKGVYVAGGKKIIVK